MGRGFRRVLFGWWTNRSSHKRPTFFHRIAFLAIYWRSLVCPKLLRDGWLSRNWLLVFVRVSVVGNVAWKDINSIVVVMNCHLSLPVIQFFWRRWCLVKWGQGSWVAANGSGSGLFASVLGVNLGSGFVNNLLMIPTKWSWVSFDTMSISMSVFGFLRSIERAFNRNFNALRQKYFSSLNIVFHRPHRRRYSLRTTNSPAPERYFWLKDISVRWVPFVT